MTAVGCCGNRPRASLAGLIARADQLPANTPRGRAVRQRIAYTVVAAKAAQAGDRGAFGRAMHGLRMAELADAGGAGLTPHVTTAEEAAAATEALRNAAALTRAQIAADLATAGLAINLVLDAAGLGTSLASTFCNRCDRTGIDATNFVISLVRGIITPGGAALRIPDLSPDAVMGLGIFCGFKEAVSGAIEFVFGAAAASVTVSDPSAAAALRAIGTILPNLINSICRIPQISAAAQSSSADAQDTLCRTTTPNSMWDGSSCVCAPGFVPGAGRPDGSTPCIPDTRGSAGGGGTITCTPVPGVPTTSWSASGRRICAPCFVPPPPGSAPDAPCVPVPTGVGGAIMLNAEQRRALIQATTTTVPLTTRQRELVRTIPVTLVAGTLDPVTLCAPGEPGNPCTTICDGGDYRTYSVCTNGIPSKPASTSPALLAIPALALAWYFFK